MITANARRIGIGPAVLGLAVLGLAMLVMVPALAQTSLLEGVRKYEAGDYDGAIAEWQPLAERGNRAALFNLGQIYRLGRGVEVDLDRAMAYYRRSAERGFTDAQQILATLLFYADDATEQDKRAAVEWWQTAAQLGNARAQYHLGVLNWNGEVVEQDLIRAYAWMVLAAEQDLEQAAEAEITMRRHLSVKEMADGRLLTKELIDREAIAEHRAAAMAEAKEMAAALDEGASDGTPSERADTAAVRGAVGQNDAPATDASGAAAGTVPASSRPAEGATEAIEDEEEAEEAERDEGAATTAAPAAEQAGRTPEAEPRAGATAEQSAAAQTGADRPARPADWEASWRLQLVAMRNRDGVEAAWQRLSESAPDLVGGLDHRVRRVDLGDRGIYHRLQIGPFSSRAAARRTCEALQAAGQDCFALAPAS